MKSLRLDAYDLGEQMKILSGFAGLFFVGLVGWRIGATLTPDAVALAIGVLFGMLAGIPAFFILLASAQQQPIQQQRQPYQPPQPIFILPERARLSAPMMRGHQIADLMRQSKISMQCVSASTDGERSIYDFAPMIGTKVSIVSRFVETRLSQLLDSDFRAARAGSMIQIFEYRPQNATAEIEREQLSVRNDNW